MLLNLITGPLKGLTIQITTGFFMQEAFFYVDNHSNVVYSGTTHNKTTHKSQILHYIKLDICLFTAVENIWSTQWWINLYTCTHHQRTMKLLRFQWLSLQVVPNTFSSTDYFWCSHVLQYTHKHFILHRPTKEGNVWEGHLKKAKTTSVRFGVCRA